MGLTRIRAEQISDIDYKQAVRVVTVAPVTLSGGAPNQVDNVNLNAGDRILVTAQGTGSQNGLYDVQTVGTGADGTWVRTSDANATGEINAGMIVMVTEGLAYADTMWKLITDNPIVIGTTPLVFVPNPSTSFSTIAANGTSVIANAATSTLTITPGYNMIVTGNNVTDTITLDVNPTPSFTGTIITGNLDVSNNAVITGNLEVLGNTTFINSNVITINDKFINLANNASNASQANGGGIGIGPVGSEYASLEYLSVSNSWNLTNSTTVQGYLSATGNITGNNLSGSLVTGTLTTNAQPNITSVGTLSSLAVTANVTGGNILTGGLISASGNITGGNLSVSLVTGTLTTAAQPNVTSLGTLSSLSVTANVTAGNVTTGNISATGNITGAYIIGSISGNVVGWANTVADNAQPNITSVGLLTSISSSGNISTTGNVVGNFIVGDGSLLTSINGANVTGTVANATYALSAGTATTVTANAQSNITSVGILTSLSVQGNIEAANYITNGLVSVFGNVTANGFSGNGASLYSLTGTAVTGTVPFANVAVTISANAQPNITSVGTLTTVTVTGNTQSGNLLTAGNVSATGNVYGANIIADNISTTGNVYSGNTITTGNVNSGNLSASGNVAATYFLGDGSYLTGLYGVVGEYLFANAASDVSPYQQAVFISNYTAGAVAIATQTVAGATPVLLQEFLTNVGYPNQTYIPAGTIQVDYETQKGSGNSGYTTYAELWKRTAGGVETLLLTSDVSSTSTVNSLIQQTVTIVSNGNILLNTTDRIAVKIYAAVLTGPSASISVRWDDNTGSGLHLPAPPASVTQFVPYNNATANINLGAYGLTAAFASVTGNLNANNITAIANLQANIITTAGAGNLTLNPGSGGIAVIDASGNFLVSNTAAATSTTTGGATFAGGIGVAGNVFAGGNVYGGNVSTAGNITSNYIFGNGSQLTGIDATSIQNGTSNVRVANNGNVTVGIDSTGNVGVFTTTGLSVTGEITATGNVTGGNINTTGATIGGFAISGNTLIVAGPTFTIDPNGASGIDGNVVIQGNLVVNGNMTYINSNNITTNDLTINMANNATSAGQANGGGIGVGPAGAEYISLTYASTPNIWVASNGLSVQGIVEAQANVTAANIVTTGLVTATGNVYGNVFTGNGAGLTNLNAANLVGAYGNANVANYLPTYSGNLENVNSITASGNVKAGNLVTGGNVDAQSAFVNAAAVITSGRIEVGTSLSASGNIDTIANVNVTNNVVANNVSANLITGTLTTAAQPNVTSLGTLTTVTVTGNTQSGNLLTGGYVSAAGNVTGNYFFGNGSLLTGIITSVANINNGTSNISVYENGNIAVSVSGVGNTVIFTPDAVLANVDFSTEGNIYGNVLFGNGAGITGITSIGNVGNCSVEANLADGNVSISADGQANLATFNLGTMTMLGAYANPNYFNINVSVIGNVNGMMVGPISLGPQGNIQVPDSSRIVIL